MGGPPLLTLFSEGVVLFRRHHLARPFPRRLVNQALANYSHPSQYISTFKSLLINAKSNQGILTGFGQGLSLPLFMSLPSQWFYRRRGLASGLAIGGAGLGGGTTTLICRELLTRVGYRKTLW